MPLKWKNPAQKAGCHKTHKILERRRPRLQLFPSDASPNRIRNYSSTICCCCNKKKSATLCLYRVSTQTFPFQGTNFLLPVILSITTTAVSRANGGADALVAEEPSFALVVLFLFHDDQDSLTSQSVVIAAAFAPPIIYSVCSTDHDDCLQTPRPFREARRPLKRPA